MIDQNKKLEVTADELELIICALETQSKILRMQASAGGKDALERLNHVKSLTATVSSHRDGPTVDRPSQSGLWSMLRSLHEAI